MIRWIIISITPPKYPEIEPIATPKKKLMIALAKGIDSEILAPNKTREKISLPRESAPNRNILAPVPPFEPVPTPKR